MKLYIKQKVFSWADRFAVRDETGAERYYVEGEIFSWGKKLHVYDAQGREAAFIQEKVWSFRPRFFVYVDGRQAAEIVKKFTFFCPRYYAEGPGWEIEGRFLSHESQVFKNGSSIITIRKEWMTWGDSYEVSIADCEDEVLALSVVLAIDCAMDSDGGVTVTAGGS